MTYQQVRSDRAALVSERFRMGGSAAPLCYVGPVLFTDTSRSAA